MIDDRSHRQHGRHSVRPAQQGFQSITTSRRQHFLRCRPHVMRWWIMMRMCHGYWHGPV